MQPIPESPNEKPSVKSVKARKPKADPKPKVKKPKVVDVFEIAKCQFCSKDLKTQKSIETHMCPAKERWFEKDVPYVRTGYMVFSLFYKINYGQDKDYHYFMKSRFYSSFVKFGKYMHDVNAIEPMEFAEFCIKKGATLGITNWAKDTTYETYIRQRTARESPDVAAERTILLMEQWAIDTGEQWIDFFRLIQPTLAVHWIRSGRLSPWLLYASESGMGLLQRFSEEQIDLVAQYIDPDLWKRRIKNNADAVDNLRTILKNAGF